MKARERAALDGDPEFQRRLDGERLAVILEDVEPPAGYRVALTAQQVRVHVRAALARRERMERRERAG